MVVVYYFNCLEKRLNLKSLKSKYLSHLLSYLTASINYHVYTSAYLLSGVQTRLQTRLCPLDLESPAPPTEDVFKTPRKGIMKNPILLNPSLKSLKAREDVSTIFNNSLVTTWIGLDS